MVQALYVEDNPDNVRIMKKILGTVGYDVVTAHEGKMGLALAAETQPDFILMDLHLPGMDGLETTRRLKNDPKTAHIPVVALTADIYSQQSFMEAGCDIYMTKPIRRATLLRTIQQVMSTNTDDVAQL